MNFRILLLGALTLCFLALTVQAYPAEEELREKRSPQYGERGFGEFGGRGRDYGGGRREFEGGRGGFEGGRGGGRGGFEGGRGGGRGFEGGRGGGRGFEQNRGFEGGRGGGREGGRHHQG